ncbi:MAG: dependent protein [Mycobacteriales bacterium]|jgi:pyridoxal phosphate enzyme (YggS family)
MTADPDPRTREIAGRLHDVRNRIAAACVAAGRDPSGVTLIAVTKTFPVDDVRRLVSLRLRELGENRDQEASAKAAELAADTPPPDVRWHFVGRLQRNKCRSVAGYAAVVHSVDRAELLQPLTAGAGQVDRQLDVMIQVSLDGDTARGGTLPADVPALADAVAAADRLTLRGLMAVAPLGADPDTAFARLAETAAALRADHPGATAISAGMSGDLEAAIRKGATHVRIGTALLGGRPAMVR